MPHQQEIEEEAVEDEVGVEIADGLGVVDAENPKIKWHNLRLILSSKYTHFSLVSGCIV